MSETEHTPAPWEWRECRMWGGYSGLFSEDGDPVCVPSTSNDGDTGAAWFEDMTEEDARLIASSPRMLWYLRKIVKWMDANDHSHSTVRYIAAQAINEATGDIV